jgi:3,4-dihydroxy 2-butanone 4-phosphate synthase/GTP cyclohydrolase II
MSSIQTALNFLRDGRMIILVDDEQRENEGDIVMAAEFVTPQAITFMARQACGLICLALSGGDVDRLGLLPMVAQNNSAWQSPFTVSIEARHGITTGISAADRAHTISVAIDQKSGPQDIVSPGHMFPLRADDGGVLARAGHTEGSINLMHLAGLSPGAVICEIMNDDGSMARMPDLRLFAQMYDMPIVTIGEIIDYLTQAQESRLHEVA